MGYGEVTGNQSVHWTIVHEDDNGVPKTLKAVTVPSGTPVTHAPGGDSNDERINLGSSEIRGRDGIKRNMIGKGRVNGVQKDHDGCFRVKLRFARKAEAIGAANLAAQSVYQEPVGKLWVLELDIPVLDRDDDHMNPPDPPSEVRVDW